MPKQEILAAKQVEMSKPRKLAGKADERLSRYYRRKQETIIFIIFSQWAVNMENKKLEVFS